MQVATDSLSEQNVVTTRPRGDIRLLASLFIVSACGVAYELIAGSVSSYLRGDSITRFSLVIGVFLAAMGAGAYFARHITQNQLANFIRIEILLAFVGGASSLLFYLIQIYLNAIFDPLFYAICFLIGALVGAEIPLLILLLKNRQTLSKLLSDALSVDYIGALMGSVAFPLLVLPYAGLIRSSLVFGALNWMVAWWTSRIDPQVHKRARFSLFFVAFSLLAVGVFSNTIVSWLESQLYQDTIIHSQQSKYQRLTLTRYKDDVRLYLNGHLQFSSIDEARYHETLVLTPMLAHGQARRIAILGGGDGLAVREILRFPHVEKVDVIDLDPAVTSLAQKNPILKKLNEESLADKRVSLIHQDAMQYLANSHVFYDVIIADLPDPNRIELDKLYSKQFYTLIKRRLSQRGVFITQATSPFHAKHVFWCINKNIQEVFGNEERQVIPMHTNVPSFGEWGFVLAAQKRPDGKLVGPKRAYLTPETLDASFAFPNDMRAECPIDMSLDRPNLHQLYQKAWQHH